MADERLKKSDDKARKDRAEEDRPATEARHLSDDDRVEMFRQQFFQSALPDIPPIPGYHVCWLTTTNPRDSIHHRMRLGYEPIKASDIPGWDHDNNTIKSGEWTGFIGVNEMLAFKIPISLYEKFMTEAHHNMPLQEEEKLTETAEFLKQQARQQGAHIQTGDGLSEIAEDKRKPKFNIER